MTNAAQLTPKGSGDKPGGILAEANACACLKKSVTVVQEYGKANAALVKLLSRVWNIRKSKICIIQGLTVRSKTVLVSGDPKLLSERLQAWLDKLHSAGLEIYPEEETAIWPKRNE